MTDRTRARRLRRGASGAADYAPTLEAAEREMRRAQRNRLRRKRNDALFVAVLVALAIGAAAYHFCFQLVIARGGGMSPTVEGGNLVLCVRQSALKALYAILPDSMTRIHRDGLVLLDYHSENGGGDALLIRRVIGVGGDVLDAAGGELILNHDTIVGKLGTSDRVYPVSVPRGRLFVTGDQRGLSIDSRSRAFGFAAETDVVGRPVAVLWPVYAIGPVN